MVVADGRPGQGQGQALLRGIPIPDSGAIGSFGEWADPDIGANEVR